MTETKKRRPRPKRGRVVNWKSPNWEPLLRLARVYVGEFMWMGRDGIPGYTDEDGEGDGLDAR
jgi:hypothetical protein